MRKLFALFCVAFLCAVLLLPVSAVTPSEEGDILLYINYQSADGSDPAVVPNTVPKFELQVDPSNPDTTKLIELKDVEVWNDTELSVDTHVLPIHYPSFDSAGIYNYTVTQKEGNGQGVTYFTEPINIQIIAYYADDDHSVINASVLAYVGGEKVNSIINQYDLAELTVTNTVTGNMGSFEDVFDVDVIFTVEEGKSAQSDITYVFDTTETVTAEALNEGTQTVTLSLKSGQSVQFSHIPYGVSYIVEQHDYTDKGYAEPVYNVDGTDLEDTTASGVFESPAVDVLIVNDYQVDIPTGISLDSVPYFVILGVVAVGLAVVLLKKKVHYAE